MSTVVFTVTRGLEMLTWKSGALPVTTTPPVQLNRGAVFA